MFGERVLFVPCDVRKMADVEGLWNAAAAQWGRVDIWINNAGRNVPYELIHNTQQEYIHAVVDTNLKGMIYGSQVAAAHMLAQGGGQIWNMEGLGSNGMVEARTVLYGTTKAALTNFTKGLTKELSGTGVLVGHLSPGMMLTEFITKGPDGEPSPAIEQQKFRKVFNVLADQPETVAAFFIPRILANQKNGVHIEWLTGWKAAVRFVAAPFVKRKLM